MKKRNRTLLLLLLAVIATPGMPQVNDAQAWLYLNLEKKITPALTASLTEEFRLNENVSEVGTILTDIAISYRLSSRFKAGAFYRFTLKRRLDDSYERKHSWALEGFYREELKPVEMVFRLRYQSRYDESFTSTNASVPSSHLRAKLTLKADLNSRWQPQVFGELFFRTERSEFQSFDEYRVGAGVIFSLNRRNKFECNYFISKEIGVNNPETAFVVQLGYLFLF